MLTSVSHNVVPEPNFAKTFGRVYTASRGEACTPKLNAQEIALVFIILAQGTRYNLEMPSNDPSVVEWVRLAEIALVKGQFLSNNMVAGVQTLVCLESLPRRDRLRPIAFDGTFSAVRVLPSTGVAN